MRSPLYCDCGCRDLRGRRQVMGMDYGDHIIIKATHHGRVHFLTVPRFIDSRDHEFSKALEDRIRGSSN